MLGGAPKRPVVPHTICEPAAKGSEGNRGRAEPVRRLPLTEAKRFTFRTASGVRFLRQYDLQATGCKASVADQHSFSLLSGSPSSHACSYAFGQEPQKGKSGLSGFYEAFKKQLLCSILEGNLTAPK